MENKSITYQIFDEVSKHWKVPETRNLSFSTEKIEKYLDSIPVEKDKKFIKNVIDKTILVNVNEVFNEIIKEYYKFKENNKEKFYILLPCKFGSERLLIQALWGYLIKDELFVDFIFNIEKTKIDETGRYFSLCKSESSPFSDKVNYVELIKEELGNVKSILVIDDCCYTGNNIERLLEEIDGNISISIILAYCSSFFKDGKGFSVKVNMYCDNYLDVISSDYQGLKKYLNTTGVCFPIIFEHKNSSLDLSSLHTIYLLGIVPGNGNNPISFFGSIMEVEPTRDFILQLEYLSNLLYLIFSNKEAKLARKKFEEERNAFNVKFEEGCNIFDIKLKSLQDAVNSTVN